MPVPIQTTNEIYKEMLINTNNNNNNKQQTETITKQTSQIYFKNYIQESLRLLREKAKEHEANLREQIEPVKKLKVVKIQMNKQLKKLKEESSKILTKNDFVLVQQNEDHLIKPTVTNKCIINNNNNSKRKQIVCINIKRPQVIQPPIQLDTLSSSFSLSSSSSSILLSNCKIINKHSLLVKNNNLGKIKQQQKSSIIFLLLLLILLNMNKHVNIDLYIR